jgi:hypothetical protein
MILYKLAVEEHVLLLISRVDPNFKSEDLACILVN